MARIEQALGGWQRAARRWRRSRLVSALLLSLALPRTAAAFRSGSDLPRLSGTARVRFAEGPISFYIRRSLPPELYDSLTQEDVIAAANAWVEPACSAVEWAYRGFMNDPAVPGDGLNTIEWIDDWSQRGYDPTAAGITDVQYEKQEDGSWQIVEADIYLNKGFTWSNVTAEGTDTRDVTAVVTHEFGHVLGLLHPCELDGASGAPVCHLQTDLRVTMYPVYSLDQVTLEPDDVNGVCFLYPKPDCHSAGCPADEVCTDDGCKLPCGTELCAADQICTPKGCRAPNACVTETCLGFACASALDCGSSEVCTSGRCAPGPGTPGGSSLGEICATASDCAGGACITGGREHPICSQACGPLQPACPSNWSCGFLQGESVCIPIHPVGGCSVTSPAPGAPSSRPARSESGLLVTLLLAILGVRRGHRARERHAS